MIEESATKATASPKAHQLTITPNLSNSKLIIHAFIANPRTKLLYLLVILLKNLLKNIKPTHDHHHERDDLKRIMEFYESTFAVMEMDNPANTDFIDFKPVC
jgi:hypothetical protein